MKPICRIALVTGALFFFIPRAHAVEKKARYGISIHGKQIGEFSISQQQRNDTTVIFASTDVEVKFLFAFRVKIIQNSSHFRGELLKYSLRTLKNNKLNSETKMWRRGEDYLLVKDGDSTLISNKIQYSGSLFYFNEPRSVTEVFNERIGQMEDLQKTGDQTYSIIDDKGRKTNEYRYRDGVLEKAFLHHALATVTLQRIIDEELSTK